MNILKYSAYSLIVVSVVKIGLLVPLRQLEIQIDEMESQYSELRIKSESISTFEDSLIYNSNFRTRILGTSYKRKQLDSAIAANRLRAEQAIGEVEILYNDRIVLGRNFKTFSGIDSFLELLFVIAACLTLFYWIKLRK